MMRAQAQERAGANCNRDEAHYTASGTRLGFQHCSENRLKVEGNRGALLHLLSFNLESCSLQQVKRPSHMRFHPVCSFSCVGRTSRGLATFCSRKLETQAAPLLGGMPYPLMHGPLRVFPCVMRGATDIQRALWVAAQLIFCDNLMLLSRSPLELRVNEGLLTAVAFEAQGLPELGTVHSGICAHSMRWLPSSRRRVAALKFQRLSPRLDGVPGAARIALGSLISISPAPQFFTRATLYPTKPHVCDQHYTCIVATQWLLSKRWRYSAIAITLAPLYAWLGHLSAKVKAPVAERPTYTKARHDPHRPPKKWILRRTPVTTHALPHSGSGNTSSKAPVWRRPTLWFTETGTAKKHRTAHSPDSSASASAFPLDSKKAYPADTGQRRPRPPLRPPRRSTWRQPHCHPDARRDYGRQHRAAQGSESHSMDPTFTSYMNADRTRGRPTTP
ncbi:hypothetical protein Efla_001385 [Eimeria flavescens]